LKALFPLKKAVRLLGVSVSGFVEGEADTPAQIALEHKRPLCARSGRSDKDAIPSLLATTRDTCFVTSGVIAGAGSGKTNTLAHRVAHLIVEGADPRRILLMAFSRRAASEMTKRVERIARKVLGDNAGIMTDALTWAGTYHGIGEWRFQLCNSLLHN
jgi:hypothetical protein